MSNGKIQVLPEAVANRIAAGEVVERPASVVKELLENSVDAEASEIEVEIHEAGLGSLRITDNGCGMSAEDARLAFVRHATSKIRVSEDLDSIRTLGFRGEALPSIASVSRLELATRLRNADQGWSLKMEGGVVLEEGAIGCAPGTSIVVRDLFFNTPARRKFLKSAVTEQAHLTDILERAAMAYSSIRFRLAVNGREVLHCPPASSLEERLAAVFGKTLPGNLIRLEKEGGGVWVRGCVAPPEIHRPTRKGLYLFINSRPVEHRGIAYAVSRAFQNLLPPGRYPVAFIFLTLPPALVDVNVHPAKREVRLRDEHGMHELVYSAVATALASADLSLARKPSSGKILEINTNYGSESSSRSFSFGDNEQSVKEAVKQYYSKNAPISPPEAPTSASEEDGIREIKVFGQLGGMYLIAQDSAGLLLFDQHALHERLLYEELKRSSGKIPRQQLLLPITFEVTASERLRLEPLLDFFDQLGLEISPFGGNTFIARSQPEIFKGWDLAGAIREILEKISTPENFKDVSLLRERALKSLACHAAIKAGERLQPELMEYLVATGLRQTYIPVCPHGRPYSFRLSWLELEKIFHRA